MIRCEVRWDEVRCEVRCEVAKLRSALRSAMRDAMREDAMREMRSAMRCEWSGAAPEGMLRPNVGGGVMRR